MWLAACTFRSCQMWLILGNVASVKSKNSKFWPVKPRDSFPFPLVQCLYKLRPREDGGDHLCLNSLLSLWFPEGLPSSCSVARDPENHNPPLLFRPHSLHISSDSLNLLITLSTVDNRILSHGLENTERVSQTRLQVEILFQSRNGTSVCIICNSIFPPFPHLCPSHSDSNLLPLHPACRQPLAHIATVSSASFNSAENRVLHELNMFHSIQQIYLVSKDLPPPSSSPRADVLEYILLTYLEELIKTLLTLFCSARGLLRFQRRELNPGFWRGTFYGAV